MGKGLLLGFWNNIVDVLVGALNLIPQIVYFLFTAFSSGIDALQMLIRKLAGLDVYYNASTGEAITNRDPLSEFIYGILGIGESSAAYQALNTVFWSLSIFAIILLVVTTMVAMIKSHYNEDSAGTSPWKYIYTAIKAILTYAIVPVVMIVGLSLSSFILRTLDNITASSGIEEEVKGIYGTDSSEIFVAGEMAGSDEKSYIHYDVFGAGLPTNSTPMGSILFKAAAYSSNRARKGSIPISAYQEIQAGGKQIFGNESTCQEFSSLTSSEDKAEYVAYQIDYAFSNNLQLSSSFSRNSLVSATDAYMVYSPSFDIFGGYGLTPIDSFSKYDVSLVFFFYDLWTFNYIVAFGGGITIFGLLLSIIVGLMSRLIKGAALFLIYPPLLGIAPLDNFKAFKSWVTTIIQQVMIAFGAIVGMNVLMLILPYLQNISFFGPGWGLLDYLINTILLIVGLMMVKDFIGIVAGFAGGADALNVGSGLKEGVTGGIKKGATMTGKIGGGATRVVGTAMVKPVASTVKAVSHNKKAKALNQLESGELKKKKGKNSLALTDAIDNAAKAALTGKPNNKTNLDAAAAAEKAINAAKAKGETDKGKLEAIGRMAARDSLKEQKTKSGKSLYDHLEALEIKNLSKLGKGQVKEVEKYKKAQNTQEKFATGELKLAKTKNGEFSTHQGWRSIGDGFTKAFKKVKGDGTTENPGVKELFKSAGKKISDGFDGLKLGKTMADAFKKSLGAMGEATGLDKTFDGLKGIFKEGLRMSTSKAPEGDALQKDIASKQDAKFDAMIKGLGEIKKAVDAGNKMPKTYSPPPPKNTP